ncbi:hypothetical protein J6590_107103, partial [Homalodisca vitripennis]
CRQDMSRETASDKTSGQGDKAVAVASVGDVTLADILSEMIAFRKEVKQTNKEFSDSLSKYSDWIDENNIDF